MCAVSGRLSVNVSCGYKERHCGENAGGCVHTDGAWDTECSMASVGVQSPSYPVADIPL